MEQLIHPLFESMNAARSHITLNIEADEISLNINTSIPLGLLINEIITNSLKHGFNINQTGKSAIGLTKIELRIIVCALVTMEMVTIRTSILKMLNRSDFN